MSRGITVSIKTNAVQARHFWDSLERDQLPFAMSLAINRLAWDIRDQETEKTDRYFDTRTTRMTSKRAMPVLRSHKSQAPDIHAIIGVRDSVAALAITGGTRTGESGDMAVPFSNAGDNNSAREILNPSRRTLPKSKWPSNIVKKNQNDKRRRRGRKLKPKPFYMTSGGRKYVVKRKDKDDASLLFLYEFKKSVEVPKLWPLVENAETFIGRNYDDYLTRALDQAVRTMRV